MIVDDEEYILKAMQRLLRPCEDMAVECFTSPTEALRRCRASVFDVILSDYRMPHMDGVEFLTEVRSLQPDAARLILSAHVDADAIMKAINNAGITKFLTKPWDGDTLIQSIYEAARTKMEILENRILSDMARNSL